MKTEYWVMYRATHNLQAGGTATRDHQHFGTSSLRTAEESVERLNKDYVGSYDNRLGGGLLTEAWIEVEQRSRVVY